jgi:hypothetical protein
MTKIQASKRKRTIRKQYNYLQSHPKIHTPIDFLLDKVDWRCVKCGAKLGTCDCWHPCKDPNCHWSVEKGHKCNNPIHKNKN